MKRARTLAVSSCLKPTIGLRPREAQARRRSSAALRWRKPGIDRAFPELRLSIQPTWRFDFSLGGVMRHDHQSVVAAAAPVAADRQFAPIRLDAGTRGPLPLTKSAWLGRAAATAAGSLRGAPEQSSIARRRDPPCRTEREGVLRLYRGPRSTMPPTRSPRAGGSAPVGRAFDRYIERAVLSFPHHAVNAVSPVTMSRPLASARAKAAALLPAVPARPVRWREIAAPASHRLAIVRLDHARQQRSQVPTPAPGRSVIAWRRSPAPEAPVHRRRAALDLAWQPKANGQITAQDLATLARSLSAAPTISQTIAAARSNPSAPSTYVPQAVLPDAGRLVDQVMERLERRIRSDRLRRGL